MLCHGVQIALQSQYDALVLPEFPPSSCAKDSSDHLAEAFVPIYPGSQFWIVYTCPEPGASEGRFYYFKLVVNGKCLLSWGAGEEENWSGRTTFGFYDDGTRYEKRGFFFPPTSAIDGEALLEGSFEIKVFRAKARRREDPQYAPWIHGTEGQSLQVRSSGPVKRSDPKRFYKYALLDPVDTPYATFSYHFRTQSQLKDMEGGKLVTSKNGLDIMTASPSKRSVSPVSPISHNMLSPPPKDRPAPPPKEFLAKDSIALRRLSLPPRGSFRAQHESPVKQKCQREKEMFDALEGLSLRPPRGVDNGHMEVHGKTSTSPKKLQKREVPSMPKTTGLFSFGSRLSKRRGGSRDEKADTPTYHAK